MRSRQTKINKEIKYNIEDLKSYEQYNKPIYASNSLTIDKFKDVLFKDQKIKCLECSHNLYISSNKRFRNPNYFIEK